MSIEQDDCPYAPIASGFFAHGFKIQFAMSAFPDRVWNCTANARFWAAEDYFGKVGTQKVCDKGSCCSAQYGLPKSSTNHEDAQTAVEKNALEGRCGEVTEEVYCILAGSNFQTNCMEYIISPDIRLLTLPCHDNYVLFFTSCSIFKASFTMQYVYEPDKYVAGLTPNDKFSIQAVCNRVVCYKSILLCLERRRRKIR